jgi:hypothetical protein
MVQIIVQHIYIILAGISMCVTHHEPHEHVCRWSMHAVSELLFLILFQLIVFFPRQHFTRYLISIFLCMVSTCLALTL